MHFLKFSGIRKRLVGEQDSNGNDLTLQVNELLGKYQMEERQLILHITENMPFLAPYKEKLLNGFHNLDVPYTVAATSSFRTCETSCRLNNRT